MGSVVFGCLEAYAADFAAVIASQVVILLMCPALAGCYIRLGAVLALVDTLAGVHVNPFMHAAGAAKAKGFATVVATDVGTLGCVGFLMGTEFGGCIKGCAALVAFVASCARVANQVILQIKGRGQMLATYVAHMLGRRRPETPLFVSLQQNVIVELALALGAGVRQWKINHVAVPRKCGC